MLLFVVVLVTFFLHLRDEHHQTAVRTTSYEKPHCIRGASKLHYFLPFTNFSYEWEWTTETMANEPQHYDKVNLITFFVSISLFVLHIERK